LPPGTHQVVANLLMPQGTRPWRWILAGSGGTLLAGTQAMRLLMDGFHMTYGDRERPAFWSRQARALLLLMAIFVPWLAIVFLTVFGKQVGDWMIGHFGLPSLFRWLGGVLFSAFALTIAILVLAAVYRVGRPRVRGWREVLPGAAAATVLWWGANLAFGVYVRHVPYGLVSGGLAAFIGLMLWMQLTALIVLFGAALNAALAAGG
ncbi:MAG TPA: YihY/virulence factor BrkB family protein, partial [Candidatus Acidoferrales bacterium]|nr:YihY/virulence factor BrkB family protein [Candidatus Acidoferrales bacterium]